LIQLFIHYVEESIWSNPIGIELDSEHKGVRGSESVAAGKEFLYLHTLSDGLCKIDVRPSISKNHRIVQKNPVLKGQLGFLVEISEKLLFFPLNSTESQNEPKDSPNVTDTTSNNTETKEPAKPKALVRVFDTVTLEVRDIYSIYIHS
jgi:hypothetical protein